MRVGENSGRMICHNSAFDVLGRGLITAQPKADRSKQSLNHAQDQGINGQTACPLLEGERTNGGHREIDAIDPKPTSEARELS
jgi:hypothetical protein